MSRLIAALFVLALALPGTLVAQSASPGATLAPGARVRITRQGATPLVATVVSRSRDTLVVRWPEATGPVALPFAGMTRLEVSTGRHRRVLKGMGFGAAIGLAAGSIAGAVSYKPCDTTQPFGCFLAPESRGQATAEGGLVGGVLGLVVGALVGIPVREGWQRVSLTERVSVGITPGADAARLRVALRF